MRSAAATASAAAAAAAAINSAEAPVVVVVDVQCDTTVSAVVMRATGRELSRSKEQSKT